MLRVARQFGFVCHENRHGTIQNIRRFLARDIPVIVNYIEPSENIGHYAVVVDATTHELILNDPQNGKNFKISIPDFEKRWHNITGQSRRWFMVVSPRRISFA
jgi:ABC-type bacteriocin/lantibiotic exporter with double-glycine peptidase domain